MIFPHLPLNPHYPVLPWLRSLAFTGILVATMGGNDLGLAQSSRSPLPMLEGSPAIEVYPNSNPTNPANSANPANPSPTNLNLELDRPSSAVPGAAVTDVDPALTAIPRSNYLLGPGDGLNLTVIGYPEFSNQQIVLPDGTISLPLVGSLVVQGYTLDEVNQTLTQALQVYLVNPVVSLSVNGQRPLTLTVAGEVNRPGPLRLDGTTPVPLSQALIEAGGVRQTANISRIAVRRALPQGQEQTQVVDLWTTIQAEATDQGIMLRDGDSIFVPKLTEADVLDRRLIARSSLAPTEIQVRFLGEVNTQGEVSVPPQSSLSEALAIAGGPTVDARLGHVTLLRLQDDGTVEERQIDLKDYRNSEQVQAGDIIIVSKRFLPRFVGWTQRITDSITTPLSLFQLLNDLLTGSSDNNNN